MRPFCFNPVHLFYCSPILFFHSVWSISMLPGLWASSFGAVFNSQIEIYSLFFFRKDLRNFHEAAKTMKNKANGQFVTMKPRTATVAARFNDSLHNLLGRQLRILHEQKLFSLGSRVRPFRLKNFLFIFLIFHLFSLQIFAVSLRCETIEIMPFFRLQAKWNFRFRS